jgi:hypothetical protein
MSGLRERHNTGLTARVHVDQPLIVLPVGDDEARYVTSEDDADAYVAKGHPAAAPISLAGVWSDLDWAEAEAALDRIRHESAPTPPIDSI